MKKVLGLLLVCVMVLQLFTAVYASGNLEVYVAPNGDDGNSGSLESPFATVEKAIDAVKGAESAVIYLREGTYVFKSTVEMKAENSNLEIRSYPGETANISGAYVIPASSFKLISDETVKNRIVSKKARDKVMVADLNELGIKEYGTIQYFDLYFAGYYAEAGDPAVFYNGEMLTLARYPNEGYINVDRVTEHGYNPGGISTPPEERLPFSMGTNDKQLEKWKNRGFTVISDRIMPTVLIL